MMTIILIKYKSDYINWTDNLLISSKLLNIINILITCLYFTRIYINVHNIKYSEGNWYNQEIQMYRQ